MQHVPIEYRDIQLDRHLFTTIYFPLRALDTNVMRDFCRSRGQAVVEYIVIFSFMSLLGLTLVRGISEMFGSTVGTLGYALTNELSTGVCPTQCFYTGYKNQL
jgi:hypothetical protein